MRKLSGMVLVVTLAMLLAACGGSDNTVKSAGAKDVAEVKGKELTFNADSGKLEFHATKTGGSHDGGWRKFDGKMTVSEDGKELRRVELNIDMNSLWTDDDKSDKPKLTNHLKSADFFEVEAHPTAQFVTTKIEQGGTGGTHTITGNLTLRGATRSITFPATVEFKDGRITANAKVTIDRMEWNVSYKMPGAEVIIHNDVAITMSFTAS
jgi:polyisoprenoid-binding protein YceI